MPLRLLRPGRGTKNVGIAMAGKYDLMGSVLIILSLCKCIRFAAADPEISMVWSNCGESGNYTYRNGSAFQLNLNKVLDSLVKNVYATGFNTSIVESQSNNSTVYGLVQCRGDLDSSDCEKCASTAKRNLVQGCHNTSGFIQLDGCFLRYDDHNFYNDIESRNLAQPISVLCNTGNSTQPKQFTNTVTALLSNSTAEAQQSPKLFSVDSVAGSSNASQIIYSLAQCWRDLSRTSCGSCLTDAVQNIFKCQPGALGAQFGSQNCYLRYEVYEFYHASVVSPPPAESPPASSEGKTPSVLGISLGVALAAAFVLIAVICLWKWNICSLLKPREEIYRIGGGEDNSILGPSITNPELIFKYEILREATSNFKLENKLGDGGFGSVYKGVLPDGRVVAVKRLYMGTRHADAEFLNEANLISRVQHRNLVKLLGCSVEGSERILVYEYLPNSSLDKFLFDATKRHLLDWKERYEIIVGTARGLAYLHEESHIRIIHRDIKAGNILLDDKHKPKIADFGLARFFAEDQSHVSTRVAGTLGYMAPEYALRGQLTEKADVFSFGVLLLEIISGRKNQSSDEDMEFLIEGTWRLYTTDRALEIMDPTLEGSYSSEEGIRVIRIGLLCTQAAAALRPSMFRVVAMLTSETEHPPSPTKPAFIDLDIAGGPHKAKRGKVIDPDKTSSSTATTSTTPSEIHSVAADPSSGTLEPR
eukprot:PITA_13193